MSIAEKFYTMEYGAAPEDPKEAVQWLERHHRRFDEFINGAWVKPASGEYFATSDPSNGDKIAEVATANAADVDAAVEAARKALPAWQALSGHQRARYLYALARQVQKHSRRLAVLETMDNGKPIRESRDIDIPLVARHFYHHAGWAQLLEVRISRLHRLRRRRPGHPLEFPAADVRLEGRTRARCRQHSRHQARGKYTPLTALAFAELAIEVGLPPGVLNIINGDGRTGQTLVEHPDIDKIAFTGSTEVGRIIRKATAQSSKKLSLELGGKSPFIVFDDADLDSAVEGLVDGIWFNQGQVCCAGSRLLVQERVAEPSTPRSARAWRRSASAIRSTRPSTSAPSSHPSSSNRIRRMVDEGVAEGATCWQPAIRCPRTASTSRPRCSPTFNPPRPSRRKRSSARCSLR